MEGRACKVSRLGEGDRSHCAAGWWCATTIAQRCLCSWDLSMDVGSMWELPEVPYQL